MKFEYYYGSEADQFTFIKIPKVMLIDDKFAELSLISKMLYGVLLDRMSLSMRNGWLDEENRVFIIYQIAEIQEDLGLSKKKAIEYLAELEKFGLVEKKRRGQGLPSILYVKSFMSESPRREQKNDGKRKIQQVRERVVEKETVEVEEMTRSEKQGTSSSFRSANFDTSKGVNVNTSKGVENAPQEEQKSTPLKNNNNINNIYKNETHIESYHTSDNGDTMPIYRCDADEMMAYAEIIKENIEYESLLEKYPYEQGMVEGIYELILETVLGKGESVLIASNKYPRELVKGKFLKLDSMHVEYVIDCVQKNTTKVRNIKKYMLAALFNAPSTMEGYYRSEVNWQYPELVG